MEDLAGYAAALIEWFVREAQDPYTIPALVVIYLIAVWDSCADSRHRRDHDQH